MKIEMTENRLLLLISRWKNEAYELSRQLESIKKDSQERLMKLQCERNSLPMNNEDILRQLVGDIDPSSIPDQLAILCRFFLDSANKLLLSEVNKKKEHSTRKSPLILENIETNIKQIRNLINQINENCSKNLIKTKNSLEN